MPEPEWDGKCFDIRWLRLNGERGNLADHDVTEFALSIATEMLLYDERRGGYGTMPLIFS